MILAVEKECQRHRDVKKAYRTPTLALKLSSRSQGSDPEKFKKINKIAYEVLKDQSQKPHPFRRFRETCAPPSEHLFLRRMGADAEPRLGP